MNPDSSDLSRRTILRRARTAALPCGLAALSAGCLDSGDDYDVYENETFVDEEPGYGGWLDDVDREGTVDWTGEDEVTVLVGTGGEGMRFGPAACRVETGTTVVWEWTGQGGRHDVVDGDGAFESDQYRSEGATFERVFEIAGAYTYRCVPHEHRGMKGVVDVV